MCSIIAIFFLVVSGFLGFSMIGTSQTFTPPVEATAEVMPLIPTQAFACATQDVSQDFVQMGGVVDSSIFAPSLWTTQSDVGDQRTTTTWSSSSLNAVAYLEYLHFDCGATQEQIDDYFSPSTFQTIFSNYSSYKQTASCQRNGLRLFEFDTTLNDTDYLTRFWVEQVTPTRVADLTLTFPANQQAKAAEYAGRLFPELPTCQGAPG